MCSRKAVRDVGLNWQTVQNCVDKSFEDGDVEKDNSILSKEVVDWGLHGSGFYPGIIINGVVYRGDISPEDVFQAVCAGFKDKPSECGSKAEGVFTGISPNTLILVVVFLLVVNLALLLVYRRYANKEQNEDMQLQVSSAVSQYFALS